LACARTVLAKAEAAGLKVEEIAKAVKGADVVMILLPDENIPQVYNEKSLRTSRRALPWLSPTASMCITTRLCRALTWM
jgi:3-hydroxyisobutyrate dehydrogenase-like beta-hydroxyacid dehydrogenase